MIDVSVMIHDAHANSVAHGFWTTPEDLDFDVHVALVHSEVSEALQEWRDGHPLGEIRYAWPLSRFYSVCCKCDVEIMEPMEAVSVCPHCGYRPKPVGFVIELADVLIRLTNMAGHYGWPWVPSAGVPCQGKMPKSAAELVNILHDIIGHFLIGAGDPHQGYRMSGVIRLVESFCAAHSLPIEQAIKEKMVYNATRPVRHGGKLA